MYCQVLFDCILNYPVFGCKVSFNGSWQWAGPGVSSRIIAFVREHGCSSHNPSLWLLMAQDFSFFCPEDVTLKDLFNSWTIKRVLLVPSVSSGIIAFVREHGCSSHNPAFWLLMLRSFFCACLAVCVSMRSLNVCDVGE